MTERRCYIAGPMRGYPRYNFAAFYGAEPIVSKLGFIPINPARIDEEKGFDPDIPQDQLTPAMMAEFIERDVEAILKQADAIFMLKGWQASTGATAERALAKWRGLEIIYQQHEDVLEEALRITGGDRMNSYGPPDQDFQRTAGMWTSLFNDKLKGGASFSTEDVALAMILLKCSRQTHQGKRDNYVDIAGYARCGQLCADAKEERLRPFRLNYPMSIDEFIAKPANSGGVKPADNS